MDFRLKWTGFFKAKSFIQLNNDPKALLLRRKNNSNPNSACTMHRNKLILPRMVYNSKQDISLLLSWSHLNLLQVVQSVRKLALLKSNCSIKSGISVGAASESWMNVMWSGISFHFVPPPLINLCPSISSSDPLFWHSGQEVGRELISFPNTSLVIFEYARVWIHQTHLLQDSPC